jgi:hypothetical protein
VAIVPRIHATAGRSTVILALVLVALIAPGPIQGADQAEADIAAIGAPAVAASTPAAVACPTSMPEYPPKEAAEGATFRGRVIAADVRSQYLKIYTLKVGRVWAGEFGERVEVAVRCVERLSLQVGNRYLISSSRWWPSRDGVIHRVVFEEYAAVGWRILPDRSVRLLRYGVAQDEVPRYLSRPDTLYEAVKAVTD